MLVSLGATQVAHAEIQTRIIADTNTAKNEQATVLTTASGMTQVNIQTPSTGGVSFTAVTGVRIPVGTPNKDNFIIFCSLTTRKQAEKLKRLSSPL